MLCTEARRWRYSGLVYRACVVTLGTSAASSARQQHLCAAFFPHAALSRSAERAVFVRCSDFRINGATCLGKTYFAFLACYKKCPHKTIHDLEHYPEVFFHHLKCLWTLQSKTRDQTPPRRTSLNLSPGKTNALVKLLFHLPSLSLQLPQTSVSA